MQPTLSRHGECTMQAAECEHLRPLSMDELFAWLCVSCPIKTAEVKIVCRFVDMNHESYTRCCGHPPNIAEGYWFQQPTCDSSDGMIAFMY